MTVEIENFPGFPFKMVIFHSSVLVYQRVISLKFQKLCLEIILGEHSLQKYMASSLEPQPFPIGKGNESCVAFVVSPRKPNILAGAATCPCLPVESSIMLISLHFIFLNINVLTDFTYIYIYISTHI